MEAKNLTNQSAEIYAEVLSLFGEKVIEVLEKQLDIEVSLEETMHDQNQLPLNCDVESRVLFESDEKRMSITLCFPEETILNVVSCAFDEDRTEIDEEVLETCGEFLNIIFGATKTVLNDEKGYKTKIAIPRLGKNNPDQDVFEDTMSYHKFESEAGPFFLEFKKPKGDQ